MIYAIFTVGFALAFVFGFRAGVRRGFLIGSRAQAYVDNLVITSILKSAAQKAQKGGA